MVKIIGGGAATIPPTQATDVEVAAAIAAHEALADPHAGYRLESDNHTHQSSGLQGGTLAAPALAADTAWDATYVPVVTQGGAVVSYTSNSSRWKQIGKQVFYATRLHINNAGAAAGPNDVSVSLPVTARSLGVDYVGVGSVFDQSANVIYAADVRMATTTTVKLQTRKANGAGSGLSAAGATSLGSIDFVAALATNDFVDLFTVYEAA